ncbi:MAG: nitrogen regulation protein NR(I) [Hyphomicrobiales bacterium]|nr:nitrogen regulation protein NR(I) [Hyphomicrobiales bacterium]
MTADRTILLADDDAGIRTVLNQALKRAGYEVRSAATAASLWKLVAGGEGDLVITDVILPDENGFDVLNRIKRARPELPVVVISANNTIMTAITAAERGAYEYLPKPFDLDELLKVVDRALQDAARPAAHGASSRHDASGQEMPLIGSSRTMQDIYRIIARMTQSDLTVMITGESGTGKELVARALHDFGQRRSGPFVPVNMAAIPRELIESELFGHEKGAFTGATSRYAGKFEQAEGGTLFLDEIGDMPMEAQTRLLRVLQENEFTTIGGRTAQVADVRIIAATHRDMTSMIASGSFREDLFFRLNVVPIRLPALREHIEDIDDLARHFLDLAVGQGLPVKQLGEGVLERLKQHHWPGNVRELENLIKRLLAVYSGEAITLEHTEAELAKQPSGAAGNVADMTIAEFMENHLAQYVASFGQALPPAGMYERIIREVEAPLITAALAATQGNQLRAAELLGINRNTLRTRIRELDLRLASAKLIKH